MSNLQVEKFDPPKAIEAVKQKVTQYAGLKIQWMDDKEGYEKVRVAIGECVSTRTGFVDTCKLARDEANKYAKYVIEQEKIWVAEIEKIELALKSEKAKIDDEKARIKAEKEEKERARVQVLVDKLSAVGCTYDSFALQVMDSETFEKLLAEKTEVFRIMEEKRLADEAKAKADAEELEKLRAEKAQIEAEKAKIEEEKARIQREKELEDAKKESAQKVIKELEEKQKQEAEEKAKKEEQDRKRLEWVEAYKQFLFKNGITEGTEASKQTRIIKEDWKIYVYRLVDTFVIPV